MSNKVNFNVGRKKQQPLGDDGTKSSTNPLQINRYKFEDYISKTKPVDGVQNIPDQIPADLIISYVNTARSHPTIFADLLRSKLKFYQNDKLIQTPHTQLTCIQGKSALNQAIKFCENQKPMHSLIPCQALMLASFDHCMDLVRNQTLEHVGADGSQFWDRIRRRGRYPGGGAENCDHVMWHQTDNYAEQTVIRLILDEGVPSRGHRKNIFNPQYTHIGVCMLKSPKTGYKHVMNFTSSEVTLQNTQFSFRKFKYMKSKRLRHTTNSALKQIVQNQQQYQNTNLHKTQQNYQKQQNEQPIKHRRQQIQQVQVQSDDQNVENNSYLRMQEQQIKKSPQKKQVESVRVQKPVKKKEVNNEKSIQSVIRQIESGYPQIKQSTNFMRNARQFVRKIRKKFQLYVSSTPPEQSISTFPDYIPAQQIFEILNQARTSPKQFIKIIRSKMKQLTDGQHRKTPYGVHLYQQGKPAFQQAIDFLQKQKPLPPFQLNQCLCLVAADHCIDMIGGNFYSNRSSDGANLTTKIKKRFGDKFVNNVGENWDIVDWKLGPKFAQETVVRYISSERIPNRAYRTNIFNKSFKYVGMAMIKDPKQGYKATMIFSAQNYSTLNHDVADQNYLYYGSETLQKALKGQSRITNHENEQNQQLDTYKRRQNKNPQVQEPIKKQIKREAHRIQNDAEYNRLRDKEDEQFKKMWGAIKSNNNTINMKSSNNIIGEDDIFAGNLSSSFGKEVEQTYTKTKTITVNGMKKTQIKKVIMYTDGTSETITKIV